MWKPFDGRDLCSFCPKGSQVGKDIFKGQMKRDRRDDILYCGTIEEDSVATGDSVGDNLLDRKVRNLLKHLFIPVDQGYLRIRALPEKLSGSPAPKMSTSNNQIAVHSLIQWNNGVME
jgi:hypothetical protein